jgi:hypothetical protein
MAKKRKQGRKRQSKKPQSKKHPRRVLRPKLSDTVNLVGACVAFCHPAYTISVALIIWVVACLERCRSDR